MSASPHRPQSPSAELAGAVVGAGALAHNFIAAWCAQAPQGVRMGLYARTRQGAQTLLEALPESDRGRVQPLATLEACARARVILLAVQDHALEPVARQLAQVSGLETQVCLHASGAAAAEVLSALRERDCAIGRMHPLVSLRRHARANAFEGVGFALDGDAEAQRQAGEWVASFGGWRLPELAGDEAALRYHAAAALLAGGTSALFEESWNAMSQALGDRSAARAGLLALLSSVVENLEETEPMRALSGPAVRGDAEVVAQHLRVLGKEGAEIYRSLLATFVRLGEARGSISNAEAERLRRMRSDAEPE